jgi:hypothetical protein
VPTGTSVRVAIVSAAGAEEGVSKPAVDPGWGAADGAGEIETGRPAAFVSAFLAACLATDGMFLESG